MRQSTFCVLSSDKEAAWYLNNFAELMVGGLAVHAVALSHQLDAPVDTSVSAGQQHLL